MTSTRGQNVSVLQLVGSDSLELAETRRLGKNTCMNGKSLGQHSLGSPSGRAGRNSLAEAYSFSGSSSSACGLNNSSASNSINRELSPVRWCDREVDGVYLGRSGWVQVQQRSLDDSKGTNLSQNNTESGVRSRNYFSNLDSGTNSLERRDQSRPINLPLPSKKRGNPENHNAPSEFVMESGSVPPPSVTPILSPPPAFRDEGMGVEISAHSLRQPPPYLENSPHLKPPFGADAGNSPTLTSPIGLGNRSTVSPMSQKNHSYQFSQTKSLDENSLEKTTRTDGNFVSAATLTLLGFHSFDNDFRKAEARVNEEDFHGSEEKTSCSKWREEEECNGFSKLYIGHESSSCERFSGQRDVQKSSRMRKYQVNGKRASVEPGRQCRARSPSSESNSSSGSSNDGSRGHQSSRRLKMKHSQPQTEALNGGGSKHFNVKRSRSLQLSEERLPRESMLMSHSSSGRSWDRVSPDGPTPEAKGDSNHLQSLRNLNKVMLAVNGQSIPLVSSDDRSPNLLDKITTSEEEQKQLIREAEKEAKVISEYMNGKRSRAAARNLLIHRYFKLPERTPLHPETGSVSSLTESDIRFPRSTRTIHYRTTQWNNGSLPKETQFHPSRAQPGTTYPKLFPRPHNTPTLMQNPHPFNEHSEKYLTDPRSKRTHRQQSLLHTSSLSNQTLTSNIKNHWNFDGLETNRPPYFTLDPKAMTQGRRSRADIFRQHSSSSSSSDDVRENGIARNPHRTSAPTNSNLSLDPMCLSPFPPHESFYSRSASAPETDDYASVGPDQRSLSLPRSFLSDQNPFTDFSRRNSFPWRQEHASTPGEGVGGWDETASTSRTVPTTPVRDSRDDAKAPNRHKRNRLSRVSLLNDSASPRPRWTTEQKVLGRNLQKLASSFCSIGELDKRAPKGSGSLSENVPENSHDFHLKSSRTRGGSRGGVSPEIHNDRERNSHEIALPPESHSMYSTPKNDSRAPKQSFRKVGLFSGMKKQQKLRGKALAYDKYDSYDSGIQIGIRGNVDSSESQDTDLQEDADTLFSGSLGRVGKISGHISPDGVRRTKSDLGDLRPTNRFVKSNQGRLASNASSLQASRTNTPSKELSVQDPALLNRPSKAPLRRSLSFNELLLLEKRQPSPGKAFAFENEKNPSGATSDDELLWDSDSSDSFLSERKKEWNMWSKEKRIVYAEAVWDHVGEETFELPFRAGDLIEVLDMRDRHWWWGSTEQQCGYFPSSFVRLRVSQKSAPENWVVESTLAELRTVMKRKGKKSSSLLYSEKVRSSVLKELVNTEREFVKILRDLKNGYIFECSRRPDMFTSAQISTIFSNLNEILIFQEQFLKDLEQRIDPKFPQNSCVGEVFLNHRLGFRVYSEYCNSYPMAMLTLQELCQDSDVSQFFEMCRVKQSLPEIPLDGYLLTPVQRICKYPLQLGELLKYTNPDHPDFCKVEKALETMRSVATLINERKRRMENLEKLAVWQRRVEGWEGDDLIELSSLLIYEGDVVRITSGMWTNNVTLFLFNHQIIYCKRDLLKRNHHIYKGRICLDDSEVVDLPDGKNQQLGVTVKYGIKISSNLNEKWLVFCCRSGEEKARWLQALAEERRLVAQDKEIGLDLPPTAKELANMAIRVKKMSNKARGKNKTACNCEDLARFGHSHLNTSKVKRNRRMGTWFTFGGVVKSPKASLEQPSSLRQTT